MMLPASFEFIRDIVYRRAAIVLEPGKEYLVETRLSSIVKGEGLLSLEALVDQLRGGPNDGLRTRVVEAMTTNETSFFRDAHPFEALKSRLLPELIKARAASKRLSIWCAASSTGQEPFSVAMLLREHFPALESWKIDIVATDLNTAVLARARTGVFKQLEVNRGLPAAMLTRYFERDGADWRVKPAILKMVSFSELNLLGPFKSIGPQDLVLMRNVLIYFDLPTRRAVLRQVGERLRRDGYLLLGGAETTVNVDDSLTSMRVGPTLVYQPRSLGART